MGKKNPSRKQGKFLGAKKSFSIARKHPARKVATWTLNLKKQEKLVGEEIWAALAEVYHRALF